jgi:hypothetical protein
MENKAPQARLLLCQSAGFLAIIAMSWLDELISLPSLILGDHPYIADFHESTLEMLLVLTVWLLVSMASRRVLKHVHYLQGFMRVCAWCRRIEYKGRWIRIEEFLKQGFDTPTSHGICSECMREEVLAMQRARNRLATPNGGCDQACDHG